MERHLHATDVTARHANTRPQYRKLFMKCGSLQACPHNHTPVAPDDRARASAITLASRLRSTTSATGRRKRTPSASRWAAGSSTRSIVQQVSQRRSMSSKRFARHSCSASKPNFRWSLWLEAPNSGEPPAAGKQWRLSESFGGKPPTTNPGQSIQFSSATTEDVFRALEGGYNMHRTRMLIQNQHFRAVSLLTDRASHGGDR